MALRPAGEPVIDIVLAQCPQGLATLVEPGQEGYGDRDRPACACPRAGRGEVVYASPPTLTSYASGLEIDEAGLGEIIDAAYAAAGLKPADVNTGAVLLTGEATRRRNAAVIDAMFAARGGSFVCAMAGHELEAELAAHGSGAVAASAAAGSRLLNMDTGGGTTKLTVIDAGQLVATSRPSMPAAGWWRTRATGSSA